MYVHTMYMASVFEKRVMNKWWNKESKWPKWRHFYPVFFCSSFWKKSLLRSKNMICCCRCHIISSRPNVSHFCGLKNSSIEAWGSHTTSIKALESQTQQQNNCFSVKAKFKLFFRRTSLHQNVKHLAGFFVSERSYTTVSSFNLRQTLEMFDDVKCGQLGRSPTELSFRRLTTDNAIAKEATDA